MPLHPNMEPADFLEILRRRKWLIVFSFLLLFFAALVYCVLIPDQYQSQTKILIIPPAVAEGMVRSTVNIGTRDRLSAISQDVLSRPRLLGVIHEIGIPKLGFEGVSEDDILRKMRQRIIMEIDRNTDRNADRDVNTFVLAFLHEDPKVAQEVAASLSSLFIGENIKLREAVTQETSNFLETQLEETRKRLEQQEEKVKGYKLRFGGELPQQEQVNLNRLQRLQDQIKNNSDSIARLQDRKVFMESQVDALMRNAREGDANSLGAGDPGDPMVPDSLLADLAMRKKKLEEVSRKYTPLHPSVVQARWEVEQLEARIATVRLEAQKALASGAGGTPPPSTAKTGSGAAQVAPEAREMQRLKAQISQADLEITALKRENTNASRMIDEIQRKVERLPQREQELVSLTRDYENIKKSYNELLDKKLKANISRDLEENQKAERFQVVEPADLPNRPAKPDRLKAIGIALLASLVIGVGGAFGLELMDPTLRGSKEFRNFFDIPILASLPIIQDEEYKRRVAFRSAAIKGGLVSIMGAYVVFLVIYGGKLMMIVQSIVTSFGGKS